MLSVALDAGGSKYDQPVLIVAGFISSIDDWLHFDKEWRERLAKDGLSYFHAQEFAQSSGPFSEGWKANEVRRRALLSDLMGIIKSHVYHKFGSTVVNDVHMSVMSQGIRERFHLEAFPLAGRTVAREVTRFAVEHKASVFPELVFEDGDLDKGRLITRLETDRYPSPVFRGKRDSTDLKTSLLKPGYTPLQAADWLAYELFLTYKKSVSGVDFDKLRWGYKEFDKILGEPGIYHSSDMQRLNDMLTQQAAGNQIIHDALAGTYLLPRYTH